MRKFSAAEEKNPIMAKRFKITGFARFFLVMIVVAPLAYIGASYYNGEDGIAKIKQLLGIEKSTVEEESEEAPAVLPAAGEDVQKVKEENLRKELEYQQKRMEELKKENEQLRKDVFEKEQELSRLKNQQ